MEGGDPLKGSSKAPLDKRVSGISAVLLDEGVDFGGNLYLVIS
jgi:hypothetical protein